MKVMAVDIETYSSVDLAKCGVRPYTESEDFCILLIAYKYQNEETRLIDLTQMESCVEFLRYLQDPDVIKTAYNAAFERACLAAYFHTPMPPEQWRCTMVQAAAMGLSGSLASVGAALGIEKQKLLEGKELVRWFCKPTFRGEQHYPKDYPYKWERFKTYCIRDVDAETEIREKLPPIPPEEQAAWVLDQSINDRGVRLDTKLVRQAIRLDAEYSSRLMTEARALTGLENPKSDAQLKRWLSGRGVHAQSLDKNTLPALLADAEDDTTRRVLEIRRDLGKTSVSKYSAMERGLCADGRVHNLLQFYGAGTGRWAGRLVQVQNLPHNEIPDLDAARKLVRNGEFETLELIYGSPPAILSQLIRTAFIPSEGCRFLVADYSAIEARVLAWLAGEEWTLQEFRGEGMIYEATASMMFHVPKEEVRARGLRPKGKVATLACGYQGGVGALIAMGALKSGIAEEELPALVQTWRDANPHIVRFWRTVETAAVDAVRGRPCTLAHGIHFERVRDWLYITLPSGRNLAYYQPKIEDGKLTYRFKSERVPTYGGRLVENCLSGDSLVLTDRGWIRLDKVTIADKVWDGEQWVNHKGLVAKGRQPVIEVDGVRMTPDHRIYTEGGWICASQSERYNRYEVQLPDGYFIRGIGWPKIAMERSVRLRKNICNARKRIFEGQAEILRMYAYKTSSRVQNNARIIATPTVPCLALHEGTLYLPHSASVEELRRARHQSMRPMAGKFREFLERYGSELSTGADAGSYRREWRLHTGKLPLVNIQRAEPKQKEQYVCEYPIWPDDRCRSRGTDRNWRKYAAVSNRARLSGRYAVHETGRHEPVYDIQNSGPKHRFTVMSDAGPMLVHNCTQAVARDCLRDAMLALDKAGYPIVFHVHDEIIADTAGGSLEEMIAIMCRPPAWAPDLPLNAAGAVLDFYRKT